MALRYVFIYSGDLGEIQDSNGATVSAGTSITIRINGVNYVNFEPIISTAITDGKTLEQGVAGGSTSTYTAVPGATARVRILGFPCNLSGNRIAAAAMALEITNITPPTTVTTSLNPSWSSRFPSTINFGGGWSIVGRQNPNPWIRTIMDI